nr:Uncharacterised protein [Escherichia coli]
MLLATSATSARSFRVRHSSLRGLRELVVSGRVLHGAPDGGQTLLSGPVILLKQFNTDVTTASTEGGHAGGATAGKGSSTIAPGCVKDSINGCRLVTGFRSGGAGCLNISTQLRHSTGFAAGADGLCKDVGAFVAIAHIGGLRCVGFGKHRWPTTLNPAFFRRP